MKNITHLIEPWDKKKKKKRGDVRVLFFEKEIKFPIFQYTYVYKKKKIFSSNYTLMGYKMKKRKKLHVRNEIDKNVETKDIKIIRAYVPKKARYNNNYYYYIIRARISVLLFLFSRAKFHTKLEKKNYYNYRQNVKKKKM